MRYLQLACLGLVMAAGAMAATPTVDRYAEGQVWEYQTRPEDKGSLLKIQKIEASPGFTKTGPVYHVSIIGIHFAGLPINGTLQHAPFSRVSLDASVTKLSSSKAAFPDANGGIAEWRKAQGGIFTVTVAEAVSFAEQTMRKQMPTKPNGS
jgi:hypothetical protein